MSYMILFTTNDKKYHVVKYLHEPLRRAVWNTGWYVNVSYGLYAYDKIQVMFQKSRTERHFITGDYSDVDGLLKSAFEKLKEIMI